MTSAALLFILATYVGLLFVIAHWAEKRAYVRWTTNPYVYTLSLAVYCSAWTYYGSVGMAAKSGVTFLTIYLGPVIAVPAWIILMRRIIRIAKANKVASIADFISLRYANSRFLGAIVTLVCLFAILPYIALQLKAISETFHLVTGTSHSSNVFSDTTTYIALALALFASYYGTRYADAAEKRRGIVMAVALESVLKLFFFVLLGGYVAFVVFDGFDDLYQKAHALPDFVQKHSVAVFPEAINWFFLCLLSFFAIFLLPRQFHMAVIENSRERHLKTAIWLFPLYLLLFNLFVYPIAWGGNVLFAGQSVTPDFFPLLIPQFFHNSTMTVLVFLGGFSAAISMIVASSIGLSIMLSNNLVIPYGLLGRLKRDGEGWDNRRILNIRKVSIFLLITGAFCLYRGIILDYDLFSVGLVSFVIIAQLAPSFFGALLWRRGSKAGAIAGLIGGFLVCTYTLLLPYIIGTTGSDSTFVSAGFMGMSGLRPFSLLGLTYLEPVPHALFWSLLVNAGLYLIVSVSFKGNYRERNYAEMFIDIDRYASKHESAFIWKGTAYIADIRRVLVRFLGENATRRELAFFRRKYGTDPEQQLADPRMIKFAENLLTGHIGTASARILISSVVKEEKVPLTEVLKILEESRENIVVNRKLREASAELEALTAQLREANEELLEKDRQKDEFLDTVSHELRTPITAIRAATEILHDDDDIPNELRRNFLQNIMSESDRLNRLINKILDLEKFESGKQSLDLAPHLISDALSEVLAQLKPIADAKGILIEVDVATTRPVLYDHDRIVQVLMNLVSNALKFCPEEGGRITINAISKDQALEVAVADNGKGIAPTDLDAIFDKFYQVKHQNLRKPEGSGLGLAICRKIIDHHGGRIWADNRENSGALLTFILPEPTEHEKDTHR